MCQCLTVEGTWAMILKVGVEISDQATFKRLIDLFYPPLRTLEKYRKKKEDVIDYTARRKELQRKELEREELKRR